jgi:hypothetical protein
VTFRKTNHVVEVLVRFQVVSNTVESNTQLAKPGHSVLEAGYAEARIDHDAIGR